MQSRFHRNVLPSLLVKSVPLVALIIAIAVASCSIDDGDEIRSSWSEVQGLKTAYLNAPPEEKRAAKQRWADGVRDFLEQWPDHPGALRTWNDLQLDYAEQLEANAHFAEAELHYRSLLERVREHPRAAEGIERVRRRQTLSRQHFEELRTGMTTSEVASYLGLPRPGWDRTDVRDGLPVESWYYRDATGVVHGIHFREGQLYKVELN